ncbi:hypothetical protein [Hydrogenophaga sp. RWCD_12]|uniref:hypothetical protein n=1 Tax=Hydrogenophaga sp. RWCD_12 TaxID=3391190 RepID=UPI0039856AF3
MSVVLRSIALWLALVGSAHAAEPVELDYRLRPERDLVSDQVNENVITMRVLSDRGVVARSATNGTSFPLTYHVVNRQRYRYTTGPAEADGSFRATVSVLSRRASLRLASGEEQPMPGQPELDNLVFKATVDPERRLLQPALVSEGGDAESREALKSVLASVLEQAARIEPIRVAQDQAAQQVVRMKVPLPGIAALDLKITASNRLVAVDDGVARVEMVYVMEFGVPDGPVKIDATGTGGGTMVYDIAAKIARSVETNTLMTIVADVPDGTLEFQMNTRQTQKTQAAER